MIEMRTLPCGSKLLTEYMPNMQSVAVGIWVRTGAVNETPENAGISHFIEHMTFKGTKKRSYAEIAEDMERIGGQMNAFTGKEGTCYYMKTLASNMETGLEILLDMFCDSVFDPEEMEREKKVIYEEMKMIQDTPDEEAQDRIAELVFDGNPLGNNIIGTKDVLATIDRDTLVAYRDEQYSRDSIIVAAAGNFDAARLADLVDEKLSAFAAGKQPPERPDGDRRPRFDVLVKDIQQAHICLGRRTIAIDDDRVYAYMILNSILGGGMSSRLFQNVRERKGLAYSVYSANSTFSSDGYFNIYAGIAHDGVSDALAAIAEELKKLKDGGVTPEEIAKAKEQIKSSYIFAQESVTGRMMSGGRLATLAGITQEADEFLAAVDAVTGDEIAEAIGILGDLEAYSAVLVTDQEAPLEEMWRAVKA